MKRMYVTLVKLIWNYVSPASVEILGAVIIGQFCCLFLFILCVCGGGGGCVRACVRACVRECMCVRACVVRACV